MIGINIPVEQLAKNKNKIYQLITLEPSSMCQALMIYQKTADNGLLLKTFQREYRDKLVIR